MAALYSLLSPDHTDIYFICIFSIYSPKKIYKGKHASVEAFKRGVFIRVVINIIFLTLGTCISKTTNVTAIIFVDYFSILCRSIVTNKIMQNKYHIGFKKL